MAAPPPDEPDIPDALTALSGTVLENRYRIGRVLGSGGMGAVFEARHLLLDRPVAIKVLRPAYATEKEYIARFLREAKSASKIRHRNVVEILDYGRTTSGLVYSVMEFLVGQDLQELLRAQPHGRLPWARACGLLVQIASGLKAAHGQGVIHRDIKPANCFLTDEDGEPVVKLVDFGIAKLEGGDRGHTLTGTAQVLGTPSYIAPELVRSQEPASPRSDIYALGVVAYRMLVGTVPFSAGTVFELLRKACFDPVPSLRAQVPELPAAVEALVLEMLAKEPQERPADMLAVRSRLVALSRQTLGAQAVEIPGSSGLPLSMVDSVPPPGSTEDTTVPREAVGGHTAVAPLPLAFARGPAAAGGAAAGAAGALPATVVAPAAGVPQAMVYDPTSSPSRSGETAPAVGEVTLRGLEASGSIARPRGRGALWLALGGLGALGVAGAFVVPAMLDAEGEPTGLAQADPASLAPAEDEPARLEPASLGSSGSSGSDDGAGARVPSFVGTTGEVSTGGAEPYEDEMVVEHAEVETVDLKTAEQEPPTRPKAKPATKPTKSAAKPTKSAAKHAGPPADSVVLGALKRKISSKCAKELGTGSVTVKFLVTTSGGVMGLTASPAGPAGQCAKTQVQGAKFQERSKSAPLKIMVE